MALEAIQARHRSIETTRVYLRLADGWLAEEYRKAMDIVDGPHPRASPSPDRRGQRRPCRASRSKAASDSGFASAPRAAAWSTGVPVRMRLTGTSSFLADRVRGTART
jgi:hypothetical protein